MSAAQQIVRDIEKKALQPGQMLSPERVMLEEFGIGRGTLREALRFLEFQGVVELKPGPKGGPVVQTPDPSILASTTMLLLQFRHAPFRVIIEARIALEPVTAEYAAERITPDQLKELRQSVDDLEESLDDLPRFLEASRLFHELIASASGNALFDCMVSSLHGIWDGNVIGIDYPRHRREAILRDHRLLLTAISAHRKRKARDLMDEHISAYLTYAEAKYPDLLERRLTWDQFLA
jgi:GntR family transcriptional repressor for pyruvate dehydrogenase complex